jgi:hypothetical protein
MNVIVIIKKLKQFLFLSAICRPKIVRIRRFSTLRWAFFPLRVNGIAAGVSVDSLVLR